MLRSFFILTSVAALSGCLSMPPQPQSVAVSATGIEVQMSNRQTCIGLAPQPGLSWSGTLQGCDAPYAYRVILDERPNVLRDALVGGASAIGIALPPVADIEIDGPAGNTWRFQSPDVVLSEDD